MTATTYGAAAIVRRIFNGGTPAREADTVGDLRTPLGDSITAVVYDQPTHSNAHLDARLELAELERGDNDADLGIVIAPSTLDGLDLDGVEAWNVSMTLPTLLRLLGADHPDTKE